MNYIYLFYDKKSLKIGIHSVKKQHRCHTMDPVDPTLVFDGCQNKTDNSLGFGVA